MRLPTRMLFVCAVTAGLACGPADPPLARDSSALDDAALASPAPPGVPAAPTDLYASLSKAKAVLLGWTDRSGNEAGFVIQRMEQPWQVTSLGSVWTQLGKVGPNVTAFIDDRVAGGVTYTYRVAAFNGAGQSPWSNLAVARVPVGAKVPAAPTELTARLDLDGVHLGWQDNSDGQAAFELQRSIVEGRWLGVAMLWPGVTTFVASPVLAGDTTFRIRAYNAAGASEWSNLAAAELPERYPTGLPAAPTGLSLTMLGGATRLTWQDNSPNERGFEIERLYLSYFQPIWEPVAVTGPNVTSFIDEARRPGTLAYRVCATNVLGDSEYVTAFFALTPES